MIGRCLVLCALALATAAAPARAAPVVLGMGEQQPGMFGDPLYLDLGIDHARYLTPWDVLDHPRQLALLDDWMAAAAAAGTRVTLSFSRARSPGSGVPGPRPFLDAFLGLRERYPQIEAWIIWNEANWPGAASARRPGRVARLFDVVARNCPGCNVIGADVLDIAGMVAWVRAFRRHAHEHPRIWGLHNYLDARRRDDSGTRALLAATRGKVWFTETGGWLVRRKYRHGRVVSEFRNSQRSAAGALRHVLGLACLSRRIRRVYLYNWQAPLIVTGWDSGIVGPRGRPRPAYDVLLRHVRRNGPFVRCG